MRPRESRFGTVLAIAALLLALPAVAVAQEAILSGTVADSTGAVLPGVTITAVNEASGNTFVAVTDERGAYRIAVRIGTYRLTAELAGFATLSRTGVELLVGQQLVMNLSMLPATLQESVTVTGEAPLIDTTASSLGTNIDARQMQDLPLNGRNWLDLTMLAPGSRLNASSELPNPGAGSYQINLDGQQVSQWSAPQFGQPRFSRDAIAEFEFIANRFDATQGRSSGVQVNAITKSGTNTLAGTFSGYFRDDKFIAADHIQRRVLPYSNQQLSGTFGGPIRKDRIHFFGNYEYEREPQTITYTSPFPRFNIQQAATNRNHLAGARVDAQFSSETRMAVRWAKGITRVPLKYAGGATTHPSRSMTTNRYSDDINVSLTQVLGTRALNQIKVGYNGFFWTERDIVKRGSSLPGPPELEGMGAPIIQFRGYLAGQGNGLAPQDIRQRNYSFRDDFTYSFAARGRHDVKLGGEFLWIPFRHLLCTSCVGRIDAQGGPIPANIEDLLPVWNDVSTWNLAALSSITRTYTQGVGDFSIRTPRRVFAGWLQDDWAISQRLTLNLGVRYDLAHGVFAEHVDLQPFLSAGRPDDTNNISPRLGFAWGVDDRTVVRGGFGRYFADITDQTPIFAVSTANAINVAVLNDGRPDFTVNPFNGPYPTFEDALRLWQQGRFQRSTTGSIPDPTAQVAYSWQTSIGVQRQLASTMSVEADYAFTGTRHLQRSQNINLTYNPATGANYPFQDVSRRPYPQWGIVGMNLTDGFDDYHALQTAFTKRMSSGWQASATYSLSRTWQGNPLPINPVHGCTYPMTAPRVCDVPITLAPDLGGDSYWTGVQHRAVFNGIWQLPYDFQLSGLYFYRNGVLSQSTYGGDLRQSGGAGGRLRPDGSIVPRNNFREKPLHRVDLRVQRTFGLGGRMRVDGIVEMFNLFNYANYGSYVTDESNRSYGQPSFNPNIAYQPRILQLGFRFAF